MDFIYKYAFQNEAKEQEINNGYYGISLPADYDAEGRYTVLKNYIANLQFCGYKCHYQINSIDADGIPHEDEYSHISNAIDKLNLIRNHENLKDVQKRAALLKEGKIHMIKDTLGNVGDEKHLAMLIYILHQENWFNVFPLPDEAFEFEEHKNRMNMIGEIYGKYFLLYNYLQEQLKAHCSGRHILTQKPNPRPTVKTFESFEDLFFEVQKKNGVYDKVIKILSEPLPDSISRACGIKEDSQFVSSDGNKLCWAEDIRGSFSFLAGLYKVCIDKGWIKKISKYYLPSATKTFNVKMTRNAFSKMSAGTLDDSYIKPFRLLFRSI